MTKHQLICSGVTLLAIALCGCKSTQSMIHDDCPLCLINHSCALGFSIPADMDIAGAIDTAFNCMDDERCRKIWRKVVVPSDGEVRKPGMISFPKGSKCPSRELLGLLCDMTGYCYMVTPDGSLLFMPTYSWYLLPEIDVNSLGGEQSNGGTEHRNSGCACSRDCPLCLIKDSRVPKFALPEGSCPSSALKAVFESVARECRVHCTYVVPAVDDVDDLKVGMRSFPEISFYDLLKRICDLFELTFVVQPDGLICVAPKFEDIPLPVLPKESDL